MDVRLHVDASAALGIVERRGVGRVRHLDVGTLWLQAQQLHKAVELMKVEGLKNPADSLPMFCLASVLTRIRPIAKIMMNVAHRTFKEFDIRSCLQLHQRDAI